MTARLCNQEQYKKEFATATGRCAGGRCQKINLGITHGSIWRQGCGVGVGQGPSRMWMQEGACSADSHHPCGELHPVLTSIDAHYLQLPRTKLSGDSCSRGFANIVIIIFIIINAPIRDSALVSCSAGNHGCAACEPTHLSSVRFSTSEDGPTLWCSRSWACMYPRPSNS